MTPAAALLIDHAIDRLAVVSGSLLLMPSAKVGDARGVWDEPAMTLKVAMGDPDWPLVLAHEIGHVEQTIEKLSFPSSAWWTFNRWTDTNATDIPPRRLLAATRTIQRCEHDAERRAIELIKAYGLGDVAEYARQANADLWRYEFARLSRRWPMLNGAPTLCPPKLIRESAFSKIPDNVASVLGMPAEKAAA